MGIAFDTFNPGGAGTGVVTLNWNHTFTGSRILALVGVLDTAGTITGVTVADGSPQGASMTLLASHAITDAAFSKQYLFGLTSVGQGIRNIIVTASGSTTLSAVSISYSGVSALPFPDLSSQFGIVQSANLVLTVTASHLPVWATGFIRNDIGLQTTGSATLRGASNSVNFFDLNQLVGNGANFSVNGPGGSPHWSYSLVTFLEAANSSMLEVF